MIQDPSEMKDQRFFLCVWMFGQVCRQGCGLMVGDWGPQALPVQSLGTPIQAYPFVQV